MLPRTLLPFLLLLGACEPSVGERARDAAASRPHGDAVAMAPRAGVTDSAHGVAEQLRRFRATLDDSPGHLGGGEGSRDALVRAFADAVARHDTAALRRLHLSRAEFAYLYFPTNPAAHPPYELDPALLWFRLAGETEKGMARLLPRYGGPGFSLLGYACPAEPQVQGANRLWGPCTTRVRTAAGDTLALRLFGPILERDGRFKFVSYFNKL